jgi:hypothetical protein
MKIAAAPPGSGAARSNTTVAAGRGGRGGEDGSNWIDIAHPETSGSGAWLGQESAAGS